MSIKSADIEKDEKKTQLGGPVTIEPFEERIDASAIDSAYHAKSEMINRCMQNEIGMGRYQWQLFLLSGFGWMADNLWLQGVAIILPQIKVELNPAGGHSEFLTLALYIGLILGATTWGILADIIGRRLSWNITLFLAGVFGIAAGGAPTFVALAGLIAALGFGVGGNLPVDGALFLEFMPQSHQWLLTALSGFWSFGQLVASLIAWPLISNFSCAEGTIPGQCPRDENNGWRYTFYTLGGLTFLMFIARFIIFNLQESPKYYIAKGRDDAAIKVLQHVARRNGKTITLTLEKLRSCEDATIQHVERPEPTSWELVKNGLNEIDLSHVKPLFRGTRMAINTVIVFILWTLIGLAYPLYNAFLPTYISTRGAEGSNSIDRTYRDYSIISVCGIPGSIIACIAVDWTRSAGKFAIGGRKLTMALATALTGIFLFLFTTARTSAAVLGYNCAAAATQNAMYGVLYAYTPESFPAPNRGTGDALASALNRLAGILAPIIAIYTDTATSAPLYVSATLFLVASVFMMLLPIETAGKAAL